MKFYLRQGINRMAEGVEKQDWTIHARPDLHRWVNSDYLLLIMEEL